MFYGVELERIICMEEIILGLLKINFMVRMVQIIFLAKAEMIIQMVAMKMIQKTIFMVVAVMTLSKDLEEMMT